MLSQQERQLFEELERQYYAAETLARPGDAPAKPTDADASSKGWVLEVGMGTCVGMVAVCGLLGAPEGVVCFTGTMMILAFIHYHF